VDDRVDSCCARSTRPAAFIFDEWSSQLLPSVSLVTNSLRERQTFRAYPRQEFRRQNSEFRRRELNVERRLKIEGGDGRACLMIRIRGYSTAVKSPGESGESKPAGGLVRIRLAFPRSRCEMIGWNISVIRKRGLY